MCIYCMYVNCVCVYIYIHMWQHLAALLNPQSQSSLGPGPHCPWPRDPQRTVNLRHSVGGAGALWVLAVQLFGMVIVVFCGSS